MGEYLPATICEHCKRPNSICECRKQDGHVFNVEILERRKFEITLQQWADNFESRHTGSLKDVPIKDIQLYCAIKQYLS